MSRDPLEAQSGRNAPFPPDNGPGVAALRSAEPRPELERDLGVHLIERGKLREGELSQARRLARAGGLSRGRTVRHRTPGSAVFGEGVAGRGIVVAGKIGYRIDRGNRVPA